MITYTTSIGDVLFVNSSSKPCKYVLLGQKITDKKFFPCTNEHNFCHVAICIFPNIFIEVAAQGGVSCRHINDIIKPNQKASLMRSNKVMSVKEETEFIDFNIHQIGQPYNPDFHSDENQGTYCSHYVIKTLEKFQYIEPQKLPVGTTPLSLHMYLSQRDDWKPIDLQTINKQEVSLEPGYFERIAAQRRSRKILSKKSDTDTKNIDILTLPQSLNGFQNATTFLGKFYTVIYELIKTFSPLIDLIISIFTFIKSLTPIQSMKKYLKSFCSDPTKYLKFETIQNTLYTTVLIILRSPRYLYRPNESLNERSLQDLQTSLEQVKQYINESEKMRHQVINDFRDPNISNSKKIRIWNERLEELENYYFERSYKSFHLTDIYSQEQQAMEHINKLNLFDDLLFDCSEIEPALQLSAKATIQTSFQKIRQRIHDELIKYENFKEACENAIYADIEKRYKKDKKIHTENKLNLPYRWQLQLYIIEIKSFLLYRDTTILNAQDFNTLLDTLTEKLQELS